MRGYAFVEQRLLIDVARDVVSPPPRRLPRRTARRGRNRHRARRSRGGLRAVAASPIPAFAAAAAVADSVAFRSVRALPLRLRREAIGALNVFTATSARFPQSIFPWGRRLPMSRRSGSCPNAPSDTARSATNNSSPR
jgi:hypothetical protein